MEYVLKKGEVVSLVAAAGSQKLHVVAGTIWITRADSRDYLLSGGSRFQIRRAETIVLEALQDAIFALSAADARLPANFVIRFNAPQPHKA